MRPHVDRRTVLALTGAMALAGVAPARPRRVRKIKKALKIGMIGEGKTLAEKFQVARDCGFDGVELDSPNEHALEDVLDAKSSSGIEIPGVVDSWHWKHTLGDPDPAVREKGRTGLERALRDCEAYGGTTALLVPAVVNQKIGYDEAWERSRIEIARVLPLATELGVKIAFENVWNSFLLSPLEAARYVDSFESDRVGWYFDVGNIVNYGWPEQWVKILGQRILKLDVKEFSRKRRNDEGLWKGFGVEIGEGDCNWPAVMKALDALGWEGWAAAEVSGGDRTRLTDIAQRMERVLTS